MFVVKEKETTLKQISYNRKILITQILFLLRGIAISNKMKIKYKIFKILKKAGIKFSENRNGIFINMNAFNDTTIKKIEDTLLYIRKQEKNLKDVESIKLELKTDFF